jgi:predicted outer membrane protein
VVLGTLLGACGGDEREPAEDGVPAPAAPRVVELTPGEAVAVLNALHGGAAQYAETALDSVSDAELRRLLRVVSADHEALLAEVGAIADSLGVTADTHPAAERVRGAAEDATAALSSTAGGSTDVAVLQRQIEYQTLLLAVLDSTVVPGTREPLLARFLAAARPTLSAHLQRAHQIETEVQERVAAAAAQPAPTAAPEVEPAQPQPEPAAEPAPDTASPPAPDTTRAPG